MDEQRPKKLIEALTRAMEEAEAVAGSTGPKKKAYVVEAMWAIAGRTLHADDASLVATLTPAIIDAIIAASKGQVGVNIAKGLRKCCTPSMESNIFIRM